ncbi:hypothetical protein [Aureibacter tunicatorum]|uniref:Uncharacterized protein n=1 Tax=Aureibacter tunicatorum TaxID=866807 RepID=A0AAE3XTC7_9BACT|nr:hypothetical protein [Aureibacter tunicatorum]MDR6241650.1 hypothetical protein [Aureibacter tunicatorum]
MHKDNTIKIQLSIQEAETIILALGNLPFNQVYEVIGKIHSQLQDHNQSISTQE